MRAGIRRVEVGGPPGPARATWPMLSPGSRECLTEPHVARGEEAYRGHIVGRPICWAVNAEPLARSRRPCPVPGSLRRRRLDKSPR